MSGADNIFLIELMFQIWKYADLQIFLTYSVIVIFTNVVFLGWWTFCSLLLSLHNSYDYIILVFDERYWFGL